MHTCTNRDTVCVRVQLGVQVYCVHVYCVQVYCVLTLSGPVDTLTARGEPPVSSLRLTSPGCSAWHTALATTSEARAGSGGSPRELKR